MEVIYSNTKVRKIDCTLKKEQSGFEHIGITFNC